MLRIFLLCIAFCCLNALEEDEHCIDVSLQEGLDISRLEGNWTQLFYTPGSLYDGVACYHLHVDSVNVEEQTLRLIYHFTPKPKPKEVIELVVNGVMNPSMEAADVKDPVHIHSFARHVASDYTNYFILYACDKVTGRVDIDVQMRSKLTYEMRKEINSVIKPLGYSLKTLKRVQPYRHCNSIAK